MNVKFIGYDQLYRKPIFGKVDDEPEIFEDQKEDITSNQNPSQPLEENLIVSNMIHCLNLVPLSQSKKVILVNWLSLTITE